MHFIEVRHSLLSNKTIEYLLRFYDIGNILNCSFLTRGLNDTYFILTERKKYIFRIYRKGWREKSDILFELDAINHTSENGISVSKPLIRKDGLWLTEIPTPEGTRYGVLFHYTEGDRPEINEENCFIIGKTLGNIHQATDSFTSSYERDVELNLSHLLDRPVDIITPILREFSSKKEATFNTIISNIKNYLYEKNSLDYGFCHGDFHNFNMHIDNKKLEVFDFDCCGFGYRAYDVSVFLWNLKQNYPSLEQSCWDSFMNGYLSQKSMSKNDMKEIIKFVTLRRIWFMGILIKNDDIWGTIWRNGSNFEHFISQLEQDAEHY
ncbi:MULTISPECIES: phosphotransferase enzyme family protein [Bacillaceae]|uniref:Phosphotransferase n=1 Tax=Evansella alkalicola TaxID=745819 RepID=A0ABS6JRW3_9BACI|nr:MULTISPECIES: phosphotransferase [Bacillaceae]MBU9721294.1 phosphotransferase [Bacillus alkalicola]